MQGMTLRAGALALAAGLVLAPMAAHAQAPAPAQAPARAPAATTEFEGYRALAVTAGVIGGAVVGAAVANMVLLPSYAYITGASMGGGVAHVMGNGMLGFGHSALASGMGMLGAVTGGFYADYLYKTQ